MTDQDRKPPRPSRRGFFVTAGSLVAAGGVGFGAQAASAPVAKPPSKPAIEPFWGVRQGGILTPTQNNTYFAAFDLTTTKRDDVVKLLRLWTEAAARLTRGQPAAAFGVDQSVPAGDSGEDIGLSPARLTITFGFGPGLFVKDGKDRYGLADQRPEALVDLPRFNGDQLVPARTGGDLSIQACADDPQVAFHAVRQLSAMAYDIAEMRWVQAGFSAQPAGEKTPRNLLGFKDGTRQPDKIDDMVWVGPEGPAWLRGGSYLVVRRIRISLEHWDRMNVDFQEQTIGRHKYSGAPLGKKHEFDAVDLDKTDAEGMPVMPENAHVRLSHSSSNDGAQIYRRGYSYNDGVAFTAERWPPWKQGMLYDAGLLFVAYQRDPRTGFIKIFGNSSKFDMLNQFATHVGSGLFACPPGVQQGGYIGQTLFEA
ncbi:MAG TPA: iron uptake transporter deferrochelatase/peroxidase subunit [Aliidongia sp.]|uniref:iron uptake transporter deferrochelatase/peroxidase subunit n=1 Tax=Aliidongia sp. TaxID=1914230 RepID=UPI002DDCE709|nr:iron uptake transporter deferrochelatase/peroxidase subunit [Aliidongia sp.]HEV2677264.1 iron uptake transporter deferrochelatase/peroxidase subunit [Aliidongia sp.]